MATRLRSSAAALGVGALLGFVVAGWGSRLAMRAVALADDREDFGLSTEGGNVVGEVTLAGTLFVVVNGVALGIAGAFLYLVIRRWLPERLGLRTLCFALIVLGVGLTSAINGNERDFEFVDPLVSVLGFGAVLVLYGALMPLMLDRLSPRTASASRVGRGLAAALVALCAVAGAIAVRHAFDVADSSILGA